MWFYIMIGSIIGIIILIISIYNSKNEKLKRATTLLLVAFFCWAITNKEPNGKLIGILLFIVVAGFIIFIWNKMDKEEQEKKHKELEKEKNIINFLNNMKAYGLYLEANPLGLMEIRHSSVLPFNKNELIFNSILYIKLLEKNIQQALLITIPQLAFYRNDIPWSGYNEINEFVENNRDLNKENLEIFKNAINSNQSLDNEFLNECMKEVEKSVNVFNEFPNDLYNDCDKESKKLYNLLKERLN